jgi:hypothetical protein
VLQPVYGAGGWALRAGQYVGVMRLGAQTIQIVPKIYCSADNASPATRGPGFWAAISRTVRVGSTSGQGKIDHFAEVSKMVMIGSSARHNVRDYHRSHRAMISGPVCW